MSLLPGQIIPQSVPLGRVDGRGQVQIDQNWYLFLYNLANQVLAGQQQTGSVPTSQADLIDMTDLDADGSDLPQVRRGVVNLDQFIGTLDEPSPEGAQAFKEINNALAQSDLLETWVADISVLAKKIANIELLIPAEDVSASIQQLASAIALASDPLPQDPPAPAGPVIPITPGASPFTYTAIHDGTICISGPPSATINVIRYGVTVPTGMTDGTIPMRKNDQVSITWSGGTAPVMNYLPNK